jgi:hypothetical protein
MFARCMWGYIDGQGHKQEIRRMRWSTWVPQPSASKRSLVCRILIDVDGSDTAGLLLE